MQLIRARTRQDCAGWRGRGRCRERAGWAISAESHRWCLICALEVLDYFLSPPFVRGGWCPVERLLGRQEAAQ